MRAVKVRTLNNPRRSGVKLFRNVAKDIKIKRKLFFKKNGKKKKKKNFHQSSPSKSHSNLFIQEDLDSKNFQKDIESELIRFFIIKLKSFFDILV